MDDRQKIIRRLRTAGAEYCNVACAVSGCHYCNNVSFGIPKSAIPAGIQLIIRCVNVLGGCDGKLCARQRPFFVLLTRKNFADLADRQLAERFVIQVTLGNNVLVHAIDGAADDFPHAFRRDLKLNRIGFVVIISTGAFQLLNEVSPKRQLLRGFHAPLVIGIKHVGLLRRIAAVWVSHRQAFPRAVLVQPVHGKCCVRHSDGLARLGIYFN